MASHHRQSAELIPFSQVFDTEELERIYGTRPNLFDVYAESIQIEPEDRLVRFFREHGDRCVGFVIGFTVACISICVGANLILWVGR